MGVYGLLSHCMQNKETCVDFVNLVQEAEARHGLEILVDFYAFEHHILENFWKSLCAFNKNEFIKISGGEYASLDAYITKLIKDLDSMGIKFVFYVDGAKGSSYIGTQQKLNTWMNRHKGDVTKNFEVLDVCRGVKQVTDLSEKSWVRPVLLEVQVFETLKHCNCEIMQCASGEADFFIGKALIDRPQAYAILSNDSDFFMIKDSKFIPMELFDYHSDLHMGDMLPLPEKPSTLTVGIISSDKVMALFGFYNRHQFVDFALIIGNDYTSQTMTNLKHKIDLHGNKGLGSVAGWIKHYKRVENHPVIANEMYRNRQFADAIHRSRMLYDLTLPIETPANKGYQSQYIQEQVEQGKFPPHIFAMHHNFYWHRNLLEDMGRGFRLPCVEIALVDLRSFIYQMLLPKQEHIVREYGRTPQKEFECYEVYAAGEQASFKLLPVNYIKPERVFDNLRLIHNIMSHQEPEIGTKFFDRYGRKNGFLCYVLRYFLLLNTGKNLFIQQYEFTALIATVFAHIHADDFRYQSLPLRPNNRCVTIMNWFQDIYRHAYYFLAKILHLSHEFPEPKEIFSGSVWTAFYMVAAQEASIDTGTMLPEDIMFWIWEHRQVVIKERRHIMKCIMKGIFDFDDRF